MKIKLRSSNLNTIQKIIASIFVAIVVFILFFFFYGAHLSPELSLFKTSVEEYDREWTYIKSDGSEETVVAPCKLDADYGEKVILSTVLPKNLTDEYYLCFRTGHSFVAMIDGVEIFKFDSTKNPFSGDVIKGIFVPIHLMNSYSGKTLTIIRYDENTNNANFNVCYIGTMSGIIRIIFNTYGLPFGLAAVLVILSIITTLTFAVISQMFGEHLPLEYLAFGVFLSSFWVICDSNLFQLVTGIFYIDGIVGYMISSIIPLPFLLYLDRIQNFKYSIIYNVLECICIAELVIFAVLHFSSVYSYEQSLGLIDALLGCIIGIITMMAVYDVWHGGLKENKNLYIGLGGMFLGALVEIYQIVSMTGKQDSNTGMFVLIGLYFLLLFAIVDQIERLRDMQQRTRDAISATKAKSEFLANMSHEIRTPINAIIGMNEMILRESKEIAIKEYAQDVRIASNSLLEIVNDILDFSKIESGKMEIVPDTYNLGEVIASVSSMIEVKANQKKLKFKVQADENLPSVLKGDDKRIRETMINILNNAVKYTEKGMVVFRVSGEYDSDNNFVLKYDVKDTGCGIKPEDKEKIFMDFERLELKKNKNIEGSGLGLAITANLIKLMNGVIDVESVYGSGSKFSVSIPQIIVDDSPMGDFNSFRHAQSEKEKTWGRFTAPQASILVVDDYPMNLMVMTRLLEKTQLQITTATSGKEMLELIKDNYYDVIFLDHMMPDMNGIETLEAAEKMADNKCKDSVIIALTANAVVGAKEEYIAAGFNDYLSKPVSPALLEEKLISILPKEKVILNE